MQKRESCLHDRTLLCENPFGGYATPTKCVAFWRLALNSYKRIYTGKSHLAKEKDGACLS